MLKESLIPNPVSLGPAHFCFHLGYMPSFQIIRNDSTIPVTLSTNILKENNSYEGLTKSTTIYLNWSSTAVLKGFVCKNISNTVLFKLLFRYTSKK